MRLPQVPKGGTRTVYKRTRGQGWHWLACRELQGPVSRKSGGAAAPPGDSDPALPQALPHGSATGILSTPAGLIHCVLMPLNVGTYTLHLPLSAAPSSNTCSVPTYQRLGLHQLSSAKKGGKCAGWKAPPKFPGLLRTSGCGLICKWGLCR